MFDSETLWAVACQAPLSVEFSRQEYLCGLPFPAPGDLPNPGIEPGSPTLQTDSLPSRPSGKPPKSCPTLCDPMDCSPPGSSVHGILQARTLEWVATASCRGSSPSRDQTCVSSLLHWQVGSLPRAPPGKPGFKSFSVSFWLGGLRVAATHFLGGEPWLGSTCIHLARLRGLLIEAAGAT